MIIKVIPETKDEKARLKTAEHHNVREFFIFGNKKDSDGDLVDFHDWTGSYRYLVGSTKYFMETLINEMNEKSSNTTPNIELRPQTNQQPKMIKKGNPDDGKIEQVATAEELKKELNKKEDEQPQLKVINIDEAVDQNNQKIVENKAKNKEKGLE